MSETSRDEARRGPFAPGDRVLLIDGRDRRYLVRLVTGASFSTHAGALAHDDVIGQDEGSAVRPRRREGSEVTPRAYLALRPTLADIVLKMPRGAQVIYPKDLGAILVAADIFPGARVLEAGVGSGALSLVLVRAGAQVTGYELREDFAATARSNVAAALGPAQPYNVEIRDVYEGIEARGLDRVLLDLPEPWRVLRHAEIALNPGGILLAYLPGIGQTAELRGAIEGTRFGLAETFEVLRRTWHIEGRSVRPDHRMVAHTGFITTARLLGPRLLPAGVGDPAAGSAPRAPDGAELREPGPGELPPG